MHILYVKKEFFLFKKNKNQKIKKCFLKTSSGIEFTALDAVVTAKHPPVSHGFINLLFGFSYLRPKILQRRTDFGAM